MYLIFAGPNAGERLAQLPHLESAVPTTAIAVQEDKNDVSPFCSTRDAEVGEGTEFLIDTSGWLRAIWYPGVKPDWGEPSVFAEELETIAKTPGRPPQTEGHVHAH